MKQNEIAHPTLIEQLRARKSYLKTVELMNLLGINRATICEWVRDGIIGAVRIGKENKFDPAEVIRYLTAHTL